MEKETQNHKSLEQLQVARVYRQRELPVKGGTAQAGAPALDSSPAVTYVCLFVCLFVLETGFLCVALAVLELTL